jgi:hypothetical protein
MRKALAVILLCLIVGPMPASADWASIPAASLTGPSSTVIPLLGQSGKTKDIYIDNVARTMRQLYERAGGSWVRGGATATETIEPFGVLLTCEAKDVRFGLGGAIPTDNTLHVFPAGANWSLLSPSDVREGYWIAGGATDNVHCAATPKF